MFMIKKKKKVIAFRELITKFRLWILLSFWWLFLFLTFPKVSEEMVLSVFGFLGTFYVICQTLVFKKHS